MSSTEPAVAAKPQSTAMGWIKRIVYGVIGVIGILIAVITFASRNDLPGCDSKRAKDTLSDIFKERKIEAAAYDEIKTLTSGQDEITCNAALTLRNKSKQAIDYKLFREGSDMKLLITRSNP